MKQAKLFGTPEPKVCDRIELSVARIIGGEILSCVSPFLNPVSVVGSVRRGKPYCKDIDIVGVGSLEKAVKAVCQNFKTEFKVKGPLCTKLYITTEHGKVQVDFYCATPSTFGITS